MYDIVLFTVKNPELLPFFYVLPSQPAGAEGGLKVVAADRAIQIESLADDEQSGAVPALHGPTVDAFQVNATGGNFGFFESTCAVDGESGLFEVSGQLAEQDFADFSGFDSRLIAQLTQRLFDKSARKQFTQHIGQRLFGILRESTD